MRKLLATCTILGLLLAIAGGIALAAFFKVAEFHVPFRVEEPIVVTGSEILHPPVLHPGETGEAEFSVKNRGETLYGMRYLGSLCFSLSEKPLTVCEGWIFPLEVQPVTEGGEILLEKPEGEIIPPFPGPLGTARIYVNNAFYRPGEVLNLGPKAFHQIRVEVRPVFSAPPGSWFLEFGVERGDSSISIDTQPE